MMCLILENKLFLIVILMKKNWNDGFVWRYFLFIGRYSRFSGGCRDKFYGCYFY